MAMTIEQVRDRLREEVAILDKIGSNHATIHRYYMQAWAYAIDAHLTQPAQAVEIDYAPGELDRTAPERVWLQIDTDGDNDQRDEQWCGPDGITWQDESIGGLEVQYIRADLLRTELTRLYAIADSVDPLVVRLGEVTARLEAANVLLEIIRTGRDGKKYDYVEASDGHMVLVADYLSEPRT